MQRVLYQEIKQSHTVLQELFTLQKHCIRTLFGDCVSKNKKDTYCYCNYKESGTMLCCDKYVVSR